MPQKQLAIIGAINVIWTRIERQVDAAMCIALAVPPQLWVDITSRINGFDGKIALIKRGAELYVRMPPDAMGLLSDILGAMEEHKRYRDGVIHAWMTEP